VFICRFPRFAVVVVVVVVVVVGVGVVEFSRSKCPVEY